MLLNPQGNPPQERANAMMKMPKGMPKPTMKGMSTAKPKPPKQATPKKGRK